VTTAERRVAAQLWQLATAESVNPGARLHCLIAATLLAEDAVLAPAAATTPPQPDAILRDALRQLADLPRVRFTRRVSTATRHARQALLALDPSDADAHIAG
jgi:hypothetical protein